MITPMLALEQDFPSRVKDWLRPHVRPRRFHAFGVGGPKTGTHSLAGVFSRYRAWHQPLLEHFIQIIMARESGDLSDSAARKQIRKLDRRMWLEFTASYANYWVLDLLLDEYPRAKFVLTIRDCYSWLDSIFNQFLGRSRSKIEAQFNRWYLDSLSPGSHQEGDRVLAEHDLWPLDLWLRAWNQHCARVLALVPSDRLLVIRTPDIRRDLPRLAQFLEVPLDTLNADRSHEFKAAAKFGLLSKIDQNYLDTRVAELCGELMKRFFPEIRSVSDIPGYRPLDTAHPAMAS